MVWNFIGVHIINRTLHGHLEYKISLLVLKDIYPTVIQQSMNEAEYLMKNYGEEGVIRRGRTMF